MTALLKAQTEFMEDLSKLLAFIYTQGYQCTGAELYRTPEQAIINAKKGSGVTKSLHCKRLAIDLNLFKDGEFLQTTDAHKPFGEFWKSLRPENAWGGDFSRPDGNHYSHGFEGVK